MKEMKTTPGQTRQRTLDKVKNETLFSLLGGEEKSFIEALSARYSFTFQQLRQLTEWTRDLSMWNETPLSRRWEDCEKSAEDTPAGPGLKDKIFSDLSRQIKNLKAEPKSYPQNRSEPLKRTQPLKLSVKDSDKNIAGDCPVASPKTVCCNLKTIDSVENCAFGCSYCTIQTFYDQEVVFDSGLKEKLKQIPIDPSRFYHYGTGQSSDSLVWGNKNNVLEDLCAFAADHPNILLEFKTKSNNVRYFLENNIPANVVCSWSLNTETMINNEEHFTAGLQERLRSARAVADRGIGVAFHFHPIVLYDQWQKDYVELAQKVQTLFKPEEVLFISFGTVTFIKPVLREIRKNGQKTKIHQMLLAKDPHGKWTYEDPIKVDLFRTLHEAFTGWQKSVYMYLCMERADIWDQTFGWHYPANDEFESDFGRQVMSKVKKTL
ncbi:MAG: hypothetical protein H6757_03170 [Candidatus Omnitrophica bacterium]|nr:hypothetical protein [Candidatus Omnitrophota bacterium]